MAFFHNQSSTPLLDAASGCVAQLKGKQEQWCAVVLSEEGLNFWADPLKAAGLLLCPQATNSAEATAFVGGADAPDLLAKVSAVAGVGEARRLPAGSSPEFAEQLKQALNLLRGKYAAYTAHTDQLRTVLQTHQLGAETAVSAASPAPAPGAVATVAPERKQHFLNLVEKAVQRINLSSGSCRPIRTVDMPSTELLYQLFFTLGAARPGLPAFTTLKIGREAQGKVLIPRDKHGEREGGVPARYLQLAEFDILCWALAIAGSIFVSQGEQPGSFVYDNVADFIGRARPDTPEKAAGAKSCLCAGKLSLLLEVSRDMRRACEGDGRDGATNLQTQELIKEFYSRLGGALCDSNVYITLNQAILSLYQAGGAQRLFSFLPLAPQRGDKRPRHESNDGGGGGGGTSASHQHKRREGGRGASGRGGGGKQHAPKKEEKPKRTEAQEAFYKLCRQSNVCINFQSGKCQKEDCKFAHKLLGEM